MIWNKVNYKKNYRERGRAMKERKRRVSKIGDSCDDSSNNNCARRLLCASVFKATVNIQFVKEYAGFLKLKSGEGPCDLFSYTFAPL